MRKNLIDCIMTVRGEKTENYGEDSFVALYKAPLGVIGVFDGCGGLGSKIYPSLNNRSGAYIASRSAENATKKWFSGIFEFKKNDCDKLADDLKECFCLELGPVAFEESGVKGDLAKSFPTTASVVLFKEEKKSLTAEYIWAGDSRGYILEEEGLVQLTRDDIVGGADAFSNLTEDARLSNFVSAEGNFFLNRRLAKIEPPAIIISATDGCFAYFKTPMEFEYLILDCLIEAQSFENGKKLMYERMKSISGDDFTMVLCFAGFGSFDRVKKVIKKRYKRLKSDYISKIDKSSVADCERLWEEYKEDYYG